MKFYHSIWINERGFPPQLYATIVQLKPESSKRDFFHLEAHPGDEAGAQLVEKIVALCKQHGLKDKSEGHRDGAFAYGMRHHYEVCDLQAAPLLRLKIQKKMFEGINSGQRDDLGRVWLPASTAKASVKIISIWPKPWIVVSGAVRRILESGGLAGLTFKEVTIKGDSIYAGAAPFWELRSSVVLPKMAN